MNESYIERRFKRICERHGMRVIKMSAMFEIGIPDRLVLLNGFAGFAEIKAPGKKPRPSQVAYIKKLYGEGCFVGVVDHPNEIVTWIKGFTEHIQEKQSNKFEGT